MGIHFKARKRNIENPRSLATARGTISLLKHIGGRYLGYIGLGLAIIDFADCISR